ncbi:MAG: acyl-CoA synthetase FdrA [Elusimicrobia bacterium]|nr:acyl-CoA synthetase FdrA [Elusimicrobiota bacterium]
MAVKNFVVKESYNDSVVLMNAANVVRKKFGVKDVSAVMATPQNLELLSSLGLLSDGGKSAASSDLIFAVKTNDESAAAEMFKEFKSALAAAVPAEKSEGEIKNFDEALDSDASLILISIPGWYVRAEAEKAIRKGKNVMVFSDNVSLEDEIFLKNLAKEKNVLFMGPDCGTSIINGKGLGFANVVRKGNIGIVGASGSGIQEVTTIIHKLGFGISQAIGVGGRDIKKEVGAISMKQALDFFETDSETEAVVIISKPPDEAVAAEIIEKAKNSKKKYVINFLTLELKDFENISFASTLEDAALKACRLFDERVEVAKEDVNLKKIGGKFLRGLYSGGTLNYEALYILRNFEIYSNTPIDKSRKMKNPFKSEGHCLVDMGEDEFTRGYPHPMMDFTLRNQRIVAEARNPDVGVILLDCALGWGCHPDPAGELAGAVAEAKKINPEIVFITSITGTDADPQDYAQQKKKFEDTGVFVFPTNRQAVLAAKEVVF